MLYTADTVANFLGYFVSLAILPAVVGGIIGITGIYALRKILLKISMNTGGYPL
jgi:hypothetical protein